ncbi:MAG: IS1182 family transposase [Anaerostipes sp.]|jgi:transposase
MAYIVGIDRNQTRMITTSLDDLIDKDNSVRVIDAYVDSLNLSELGFFEYSGTNKGQAPYKRTDLLKLHIYGYLNKIRSSRALEIETKRNIELMWLINAITPDHGTIAGFVQKNKKAFHETLKNLTLILKGWGLIDGQLIAIDGTKIRAQNSKHNCITKTGLDKKIEYADAQINAYLMSMEKEDTITDAFAEKLQRYKELKEQYLAQKEELKKEGLEQKSLTDTDSRRMKNNGSLDICYNIQSVVDSKNHFVIDISTTNDINDQNQLYAMAKDASELLDLNSPTVIADTGYYNGTEIKNCIDDGMAVYIKKAKANNKTKNNEFRKEKFVYDANQDIYICPAGNQLSFFENTSKNGIKYRRYKCTDCNSCKYKEKCTTSSSGRTVQRWEHEDVLEKVFHETWTNNEVYKKRRCIVEHPFGTVKRTFGYNYFLRRQKESVDAEAASMFIAYNIKRLLSMHKTQELVMKFR